MEIQNFSLTGNIDEVTYLNTSATNIEDATIQIIFYEDEIQDNGYSITF